MNFNKGFQRIARLVRGVVLSIAAAASAAVALFPGIVVQEAVSLPEALDSLPDYAYIDEIRELTKEGRLMEAEQLADFAISGNLDADSAREILDLRATAHKERTSALNRVKRAIKGFVVGDGHSIEELGGSIASDMFLYGDIRDLCKQGYYRVTDQTNKTDNVVLALAAVGVLTEVVDAADWAPAVLKAFKKVNALSSKFCDYLVTACKRSKNAKKLDKGLKSTFIGVKELCDGAGTARAAGIMKHIDDADELKTVAKMAKKAPDATTIALHVQGKQGIKTIERLSMNADGAEVLAKAARKGPKGFDLLHDMTKDVRRVSRFGKILKKGQIFELLGKLLPLGWIRAIFGTLAAVLGIRSGVDYYRIRRA